VSTTTTHALHHCGHNTLGVDAFNQLDVYGSEYVRVGWTEVKRPGPGVWEMSLIPKAVLRKQAASSARLYGDGKDSAEQPDTETEEQPDTETEEQPDTETEEQPDTETEEQPDTETEEQPDTEKQPPVGLNLRVQVDLD
jgi:hypothetical protein